MTKSHSKKADPVQDALTPMPELAAYLARALKQPLPAEVVDKAKAHMLDTIASMVSGAQMKAGSAAIAYIKALGETGTRSAVAGTRLYTSPVHAALANGMFAHADETDDSHAASLTHPGCGIVPAVLAAAEFFGRSGQDMLRAMVLGYDICARLTLSLHSYAFRVAGHSTHTFGPNFGAAAAAGALAGLDETQCRHVMSYAAQQASGVACWMRDKDHIEKSFDFGGMAARNGVSAAIMVASGCTGVDDVFSGERNFYHAFGDDPDRLALGRELGSRYEILGTSIKRWTVGSPIQAPLDSTHTLVHRHQLRPDAIKAVRVRIPHESLTIVNNRDMPEICLQHLVATMLIDGNIDFHSAHDRARMQDSRVLALRALITLEGDDELSKAMPSRQGIVEITLNDGSTVVEHTKAVRGTPLNPMTREEVQTKAMGLLTPVLGEAQSRVLCDTVWSLEKSHDARAFTALMQPTE
ncbi:MmgE/PrpD family protein [Bordetella sp. LUAb4]|uniref:MmgE/PrpD family protein n=1 Tax=Bordetella sp. LUAb4 TaxID=2843195 RepID=UPI001E5CDB8B|nr:MmgE/PrpD family protein [Bordetella sp. LUAb4]